MKRTKRFLAMLMLLILCVGEISSTGLRVYAAGDEELTEDENASDQEMDADGSEIFVKDQSNTMLGTGKMCDPSPYAGAWEGSYVYFGKYGDNFDKPLSY